MIAAGCAVGKPAASLRGGRRCTFEQFLQHVWRPQLKTPKKLAEAEKRARESTGMSELEIADRNAAVEKWRDLNNENLPPHTTDIFELWPNKRDPNRAGAVRDPAFSNGKQRELINAIHAWRPQFGVPEARAERERLAAEHRALRAQSPSTPESTEFKDAKEQLGKKIAALAKDTRIRKSQAVFVPGFTGALKIENLFAGVTEYAVAMGRFKDHMRNLVADVDRMTQNVPKELQDDTYHWRKTLVHEAPIAVMDVWQIRSRDSSVFTRGLLRDKLRKLYNDPTIEVTTESRPDLIWGQKEVTPSTNWDEPLTLETANALRGRYPNIDTDLEGVLKEIGKDSDQGREHAEVLEIWESAKNCYEQFKEKTAFEAAPKKPE